MVSEAHQGRKPIGTTVAEYYELELMRDVKPQLVAIVEAFISQGVRGIAALCYLDAWVRSTTFLPVPEAVQVGAKLTALSDPHPRRVKQGCLAIRNGGLDRWVAQRVDEIVRFAIGSIDTDNPPSPRFPNSGLVGHVVTILGKNDRDAQNTITKLITHCGFEGLLCVLMMDAELGLRGRGVCVAMDVVQASLNKTGISADGGSSAYAGLVTAVKNSPDWLIYSVSVYEVPGPQGLKPTDDGSCLA